MISDDIERTIRTQTETLAGVTEREIRARHLCRCYNITDPEDRKRVAEIANVNPGKVFK